jgi:hypothetical protein
VRERDVYSCSVKCVSDKGSLYQIKKKDFSFLKLTQVWKKIVDLALIKEGKRRGAQIQTKPLKIVSEHQVELPRYVTPTKQNKTALKLYTTSEF